MAVSKFSAAKVSTARDVSPFKSIITGGPGVGKTHFVSTIVSEDGRVVWLLSVEEGGKGVSPNHQPAHFEGPRGTWLIPSTWDELLEAMRVFRDEKNAFRPKPEWVDRTVPEGKILDLLVSMHPTQATINDIAAMAELTPTATSTLLGKLVEAGKVREGKLEVRAGREMITVPGYAAKPDATWMRPHVHMALDSLSGVEKLIHNHVCGVELVKSMADKDYNALWNKALPLWETFLGWLDSIRATGTHVWIVAHASEGFESTLKTGQIYRKQDLQMRGTNKVLEEARATIRNWADNVLYLVKDVQVVEGDKKRRAIAKFNSRRLITSDTGMCAAKTRVQVPAELPATWPDWRNAVKAGAPAKPAKLRAEIDALLPNLDEEERVAFQEDLKAADSPTKLAAALSRLQGLVACAVDERAHMDALTGDGPPPRDAAGDNGELAPEDQGPPPPPSSPSGPPPGAVPPPMMDSEPAGPGAM